MSNKKRNSDLRRRNKEGLRTAKERAKRREIRRFRQENEKLGAAEALAALSVIRKNKIKVNGLKAKRLFSRVISWVEKNRQENGDGDHHSDRARTEVSDAVAVEETGGQEEGSQGDRDRG